MKVKLGTLIFVGLLSVYASFAQNEVNFKHKTLVKELQKAGVPDMSVIEEITLPDSVYFANRIKGKYFAVKNNNIDQYQYIYVGRVNSCRAGGCSLSKALSNEEESEYFDYYILFDKSKVVKTVKVFNYRATHGHEITAKGWLKQFIGYNGAEPLQVNKNIDAISGATISVYAITIDIELKTDILKNWCNL